MRSQDFDLYFTICHPIKIIAGHSQDLWLQQRSSIDYCTVGQHFVFGSGFCTGRMKPNQKIFPTIHHFNLLNGMILDSSLTNQAAKLSNCKSMKFGMKKAKSKSRIVLVDVSVCYIRELTPKQLKFQKEKKCICIL